MPTLARVKLPPDAEIPLPKLLQYLLVPLARADKSKFLGYRLRMGDYRILFDIEGDVIVIQKIGNRKDVYD